MFMHVWRMAGEELYLLLKAGAQIADTEVEFQLQFFFERKFPFLLFTHQEGCFRTT